MARHRLARALAPLACLSVLACGQDAPPPAAAPPPPPPAPAPIAAPRSVATAAAFDLVVVAGGAALVVGTPAADGGGLRISRLTPGGALRGAERVVWSMPPTEIMPVAPDALEVAASAGGGRLAIAWVGREGRSTGTYATHGTETGEAFAPVERLSDLPETQSAPGRGRVSAAAALDGTVTVRFARGPVACPDGSSGCAGFGARRLGISGGAERDGLGVAVPAPCERALVGQVFLGGAWTHGVCARASGVPKTTVYSIRFDPEYARSDDVLPGCEPLGVAPFGEGAAVVGACGDRVDAVVLFDGGRERHAMTGVRRSVSCDGRRPTLSLQPAEGVAREVLLQAPVERLEAVLPEEVAPAGARAVWTGEALLIAHAIGREVALRRYQCEAGGLARTDPP